MSTERSEKSAGSGSSSVDVTEGFELALQPRIQSARRPLADAFPGPGRRRASGPDPRRRGTDPASRAGSVQRSGGSVTSSCSRSWGSDSRWNRLAVRFPRTTSFQPAETATRRSSRKSLNAIAGPTGPCPCIAATRLWPSADGSGGTPTSSATVGARSTVLTACSTRDLGTTPEGET